MKDYEKRESDIVIAAYLNAMLAAGEVHFQPIMFRHMPDGGLEMVCDMTAYPVNEPSWSGFGKFTIPFVNARRDSEDDEDENSEMGDFPLDINWDDFGL